MLFDLFNYYKNNQKPQISDSNDVENIKTLYHQTSKQNAKSILKSGCMYPGVSGLAGGGVYFATNPKDTNHKAINKGVILECEVALGRVKTISPNGSDIKPKQLYNDGYQSVLIPRSGGLEYVVYNHEHIISIKKFKEYVINEHYTSYNNSYMMHQPSGTSNF